MIDRAESAEALWDARYTDKPQLWSGRVNAAVADLVAPLAPTTALDIGCGEGGDVIWLAERGWMATGIDVSGVAIARASSAAAERGLGERARFQRRDLEVDGEIAGQFDLVLSSYLHSPGAIDRRTMLRAASRAVAPRGRLLVVGHGAPPPWADASVHEHAPMLPDLNETLGELALDGELWHIELAEERARQVTAPDGTAAELLDIVVFAQRR